MNSNKRQKNVIAKLQSTKENEFEALANSFNTMQTSSSVAETISKTNLAREHTSQIMASDWKDLSHTHTTSQKEKNILTCIKGIDPQNAVEAMLASQMISTHNAAMKAFTKAEGYLMHNNIEYKKLGWNAMSVANKLLRTYTIQMDALNRYRGKGQQKITVEHISINDGAKAVIGNIAANELSRGEG